MSLSRRKFIALAGGGAVFAATAGAGVFLGTRTPEAALAPWGAAGTYTDPRKQALSYAILAPNPHNRQPWLADLRQAGSIIIYREKDRNLPETDPFDRQLTIGMGCFLELLEISARQGGHRVTFTLFPQGENGPVAVADFKPTRIDPDPLFPYILERRSCKEPFEARVPAADAVAQLAAYARIVVDEQSVADIRDLTWQAWLTEMNHPPTLKESVDLMRFGKAEIEANPDGIDLGGPFLESLHLLGVVSREAQLDPHSTGFQEGIKIYREMLGATPAYALITTPTNTREAQIEAGRRWVRLNLMTTKLGLGLHPVSQALQEFPEMAVHYARAHEMLAEPGHTVQMLGRLGYGPKIPRTPRWPLEKRLVET